MPEDSSADNGTPVMKKLCAMTFIVMTQSLDKVLRLT